MYNIGLACTLSQQHSTQSFLLHSVNPEGKDKTAAVFIIKIRHNLRTFARNFSYIDFFSETFTIER